MGVLTGCRRGLNANILWYNVTTGIVMYFGRFAHAIPILAIAGSLAAKKKAKPSAGTMPSDGPLSIGFLLAVIVIFTLLQYLPALALGHIAEHFLAAQGATYWKWERLNPDDTVDVPADMTRLTLDTIALCGFDYRFNSFYRDTPHPFVLAMLGALEAAQAQARELPIQRKLHPGRVRKVQADQQLMIETVRRIIDERRKSGALGTVNDLLDRMLTGVDRQSGEKLDQENIIAQCITFLIAGHETTSGLLSFALYALIKNPEALARGYEEVDRVLGPDLSAAPTDAQTRQLPYLSQILEETLRLWPTAPAFTRKPYKDVVLGGKYRLERGSAVVALTPMPHRDRKIWGENPEAFDPDRFSCCSNSSSSTSQITSSRRSKR